MASAASTAAAPFWRAAGMTYITYSNICASLVRSCLKEPHKTDALSREKVHFSVSKWADGKPEKPSTISSLSFSLSRDDFCCWSVFRFSPSFQICAICRLEPSFIGPVNYMIYLVVWWKVKFRLAEDVYIIRLISSDQVILEESLISNLS